MPSTNSPIELRIPLESAMLPLATSFSEQAGMALGLGPKESLKLTLAAEEVFTYLARHSKPDRQVVLEASYGGYFVELRAIVPSEPMELSVFNCTASPHLDDEEGLDQLGLLLASRAVERFSVQPLEGERMALSFRKEKAYPPAQDQQPPLVEKLNDFVVEQASPQQGKLISRLLTAHHRPSLYPPNFAVPGKLADMLESGRYRAGVATDKLGHIGGCLLWQRLSAQTVEAFGPYLFGQTDGQAMARDLLEQCLNAFARGKEMGLVLRYHTPVLPAEYFESLGELTYRTHSGAMQSLDLHYRQLKEDPGMQVWAHPAIAGFLEEQYARLYLPRHVVSTYPEGENRPPHSVIGVRINRLTGWVSLQTLVDGRDFGANLTRHLKFLGQEGLHILAFVVDLGHTWASNVLPELLSQGFTPRLVLPLGGRSDLLMLQPSGEGG